MDIKQNILQKVGTSSDNQVLISLIILNYPNQVVITGPIISNLLRNYCPNTTEFSAKSGYFYRQLGTFELDYP